MRKMSEIIQCFETLPVADVKTVLGGRRPLILAPHPDDESLGCGGLIAAACAEGTPPVVVILTDGSASHPGSKTYPPEKLRDLREAEARLAVKVLGLPEENLYFLRQQDTQLADVGQNFEAAVTRIIGIGRQSLCNIVIGPWHGDPHCDHVAAAGIATAVAEQTGLPLLSYPVWGWLRQPDDLVDETRVGGWRLAIADHLICKGDAIRAHRSQYDGIIADAQGFQLPQALLEIFERPFEVLIA